MGWQTRRPLQGGENERERGGREGEKERERDREKDSRLAATIFHELPSLAR